MNYRNGRIYTFIASVLYVFDVGINAQLSGIFDRIRLVNKINNSPIECESKNSQSLLLLLIQKATMWPFPTAAAAAGADAANIYNGSEGTEVEDLTRSNIHETSEAQHRHPEVNMSSRLLKLGAT
jgi:hypothetical protein